VRHCLAWRIPAVDVLASCFVCVCVPCATQTGFEAASMTLKELDERVRTAQSQLLSTEHDLKRTRASLREARAEVATAESRVRKLKDEAARHESQSALATRAADVASREAEAKELALDEAARRLESVKLQVDAAERDVARLNREIDAATARRDAATAEATGAWRWWCWRGRRSAIRSHTLHVRTPCMHPPPCTHLPQPRKLGGKR